MPNRSVIFTIVLAAAVFGVLISGCNRSRRTASAPRQDRRQVAQVRNVRPAEVLSASAHRPQARVQSQPQRQYVVGPTITEPLPEPVALAHAPIRQVPAYAAPAPVYHSAPITYEQPRPVGPELAMARSALSPMAAPAVQQGYRQRLPSAPIPELEPVRQRRMPSARTNSRPVAEVMMSSNNANQDLQRALAPLGAPVVAEQGWVSSPTTAMRY